MNNRPEQPWSLKMVAPLEPGIVCIDIDRMLQFYTEVVGLKFATDAEASPEMSTEFGTGPHGFRIIRLQTPYGERIKLIQPKQTVLQQNPVPEWVFERQGITYITFVIARCPGSRAAVEKVRCRGDEQRSGRDSQGHHRYLCERSGRELPGIRGICGSRILSPRPF